MFCALSALILASHASRAAEEETWRLPRDAGYARQELERQFGTIYDSQVVHFEIDGVPVRRASIGWKTFGWKTYGRDANGYPLSYPVTYYHWRTYDFLHNTLLYQSDD